MRREDAIKYVSFIVDDAGYGEEIDSGPHAFIREAEKNGHDYSSVLVGWQCGFEPLFVAVHSYLDCQIDEEEAEELATDFLKERGWFGDSEREPDYIIMD